ALMLTSLTEGTTRCIRPEVPRDTLLMRGESGVAWKEPAPFPAPPTLVYARASDGSVRSLGTTYQNQPDDFNTMIGNKAPYFVEAGNRLYWTAFLSDSRGATYYRLMSANLDGTDLRELFGQKAQPWIDRLSLHAYKGILYGCITEAPTLVKDTPVRKRYLCRLHPQRTDPREILYNLPAHYFPGPFEGKYLYLNLREPDRNLWTAMTDPYANVPLTSTLCRISLER
ncbi:MAG: hypothetical protein JWN14_779, partial [Chthonomonadales bacterium]|nr:hypothetical protein [Chthonomonadales bacterium]